MFYICESRKTPVKPEKKFGNICYNYLWTNHFYFIFILKNDLETKQKF